MGTLRGNRIAGILTIFAGALAGAATSALFYPKSAAPQAPATLSAAARPQNQRPNWAMENAQLAKMTTLEERLGKLEQAKKTVQDEHEAEGAAQPPPEVMREETLRRYQEAIAEHQREIVDAGWAPSAEAALRTDLGKMGSGDGHFNVVNVDCRSKTCAGELEWSSYKDAVSNYSSLIGRPFQIPCGHSLLLPEPSQPEKAYRTTILFHCEEARKKPS